MIRDAASWATRPPLTLQVAMAPGAAADFGQILAALAVPGQMVRPVPGAVSAGPDAGTVVDRTPLPVNPETVTPDDPVPLFAGDDPFVCDSATPPISALTGHGHAPATPLGDAADPDARLTPSEIVPQRATTGIMQVAYSPEEPVSRAIAPAMADIPAHDREHATFDIDPPSGPALRPRRTSGAVAPADNFAHQQTALPDRPGNIAPAQSAPMGSGPGDWPGRAGARPRAAVGWSAAITDGTQNQGLDGAAGGGIAVDVKADPAGPKLIAARAPGLVVDAPLTADPPNIGSAAAPDNVTGMILVETVRASGDGPRSVQVSLSGRNLPSGPVDRSAISSTAAQPHVTGDRNAIIPDRPQYQSGGDRRGTLPVPLLRVAARDTQLDVTAQAPARVANRHSPRAGFLEPPAFVPVRSTSAPEQVVAAQTDPDRRAARMEPLPGAVPPPFTVRMAPGQVPNPLTGLNNAGGRTAAAVDGPQLGNWDAVAHRFSGAAPTAAPASPTAAPAAPTVAPAATPAMSAAPTAPPAATPAISAAPSTKGLDRPTLPTRLPSAQVNLPHRDIPGRDRDLVDDNPAPLIADQMTDRTTALTDSQSLRDTRAAAPDPVRVMQQIVTAATGGQTTDIRLDPAELGQVRLQVTSDSSQISVTLLADRADTAEMLRRHAGELAQDLRALGYSNVNLSFGPGPGQGDGRAHAPQGSALPETAPHIAPDSSDPPPGPAPQSALDLRL